MNDEYVVEDAQVKPKYIPTAEELVGETWAYCYGQQVVMPPEGTLASVLAISKPRPAQLPVEPEKD